MHGYSAVWNILAVAFQQRSEKFKDFVDMRLFLYGLHLMFISLVNLFSCNFKQCTNVTVKVKGAEETNAETEREF